MTISLYLKPSRKKRSPGTVYLRIADGDVRRFLSLGVEVHESKWSAEQGRVKRSHQDAYELNRQLDHIMQVAQEVKNRLQASAISVDADRVRDTVEAELNDEVASEDEDDFLALLDYEVEQYRRRGQYGTHKNKRAVVRKFKEFYEREYGRDRLPYEAVDARLFRRFRTFCYEVRGNAVNTVGKALSVMRTFVRIAMKEGKIDRNDYPFEHITIDSERVTRDKLTPEQVYRIEEVETRTSLEREVQNWFMWAYYLGGLRFGDVAMLQRKHIRRGRVYLRTEKTGEPLGIPISEKAQPILDQYDDRSKEPEAWVFPILDGVSPEPWAKEERKKRKESRNVVANETLRTLAGRAGIEQHVTFHLSRNAALWRLYQKTDDIYKVSKIAGHASVSQTEEYLQGFEDESMFDDVMDL